MDVIRNVWLKISMPTLWVGLLSMMTMKLETISWAHWGCVFLWLLTFFAIEHARNRRWQWWLKSLVWSALFTWLLYSLYQVWQIDVAWSSLHQTMMMPWLMIWGLSAFFAWVWHVTTHEDAHGPRVCSAYEFWLGMRLVCALLLGSLAQAMWPTMGLFFAGFGFILPSIFAEKWIEKCWKRCETIWMTWMLLVHAMLIIALLRYFMHGHVLTWFAFNSLCLWMYAMMGGVTSPKRLQKMLKWMVWGLFFIVMGFIFWHGHLTMDGHACRYIELEHFHHYTFLLPWMLGMGFVVCLLLECKACLNKSLTFVDQPTWILVWLISTLLLIYHPSLQSSWGFTRSPSCLHLAISQASADGWSKAHVASMRHHVHRLQHDLKILESGMAWLPKSHVQDTMHQSHICRMQMGRDQGIGMQDEQGFCTALIGQTFARSAHHYEVLVGRIDQNLLWWPSGAPRPSVLTMMQYPQVSLLVAGEQKGKPLYVCMGYNGHAWQLGQWLGEACRLGQKDGRIVDAESAFLLLVMSKAQENIIR